MSISNTYHEELTLKSKLKFALPKVDTVGLNIHVISNEILAKWFQSLDKLMKCSLEKLTFDLIDIKFNEQLMEFLFKRISNDSKEITYPSQVILLVEHILFSSMLEKQINKQSKLSIRNMKFVFFSIFFIRKIILHS